MRRFSPSGLFAYLINSLSVLSLNGRTLVASFPNASSAVTPPDVSSHILFQYVILPFESTIASATDIFSESVRNRSSFLRRSLEGSLRGSMDPDVERSTVDITDLVVGLGMMKQGRRASADA